MTAFIVYAVVLTAAALALVLPPLLRSAAPAPRATRSAGAVALLLPLGAVLLYVALGSPAGLDAAPHARADAPGGPDAAARPPAASLADTGTDAPPGRAQIEGMVQRLANRLRDTPDDAEGWRMLARSYETLGRFAEAVPAYQQLERLRPDDATLLTEHAVTLAMSRDQRLSGAPERLIDRALQVDPRHLQALALSGSAAYEREDYARAVATWQRILDLAPADAELTASIRDSIAKAQGLANAARRPR